MPSIAQFAINREGYGGDWFGILYLSGLDGWNIWREGHFIPKGYVYVDVDPSVDEIKEEYLYPEEDYIYIVIEVMELRGCKEEANALRDFLKNTISIIKQERDKNIELANEWCSFVELLKQDSWKENRGYLVCKNNEARLRLKASYSLKDLVALTSAEPMLSSETSFLNVYKSYLANGK